MDGLQGGLAMKVATAGQGILSFTYTGTQTGTDKITAGIFGEVIQELGSADVTWAGGPDLSVPLFAPPMLKSQGGKTVFVTEWTENRGTIVVPPSTTRYFISSDAVVEPATARVIGERPIP